MDTKKQLTIAWTVAGILAVLLLISLYFVMNPKKDLGTVLQNGKEDISEQRNRIRESCNGTDTKSREECQRDLDELTNILRDFSKDIRRATSTPAAL